MAKKTSSKSKKQEELEAERFIHRALQYLKSSFPEKTQEMDDEEIKNKSAFPVSRNLVILYSWLKHK